MSVYERYRQAYWGTRGALEKAEQSRQALLEHAEDRANAERERELNRALSAGEVLDAIANDFEWHKTAKPEDVTRLGELMNETNRRVFGLLGIEGEAPEYQMPDVMGMRWALRAREAHDRLAKMEHLDAEHLEGVLSKEADAIIAEIGLDNLARIFNTAQQTRTLSEAEQRAMTPTGPPAEGPGGPRNVAPMPQAVAPLGPPATHAMDPLAPGLTVKERVIATLRPYAPLPLAPKEQQPGPGEYAASTVARAPSAGYQLPEPVTPREPAVPAVPPAVSGPFVSAPTPPTASPARPAPPRARTTVPPARTAASGGPTRAAAGAAAGRASAAPPASEPQSTTTSTQIARPRSAELVAPGGAATAAPSPTRPGDSYPSMRGTPVASRMADGIDAARKAGFSDDEILNYLIAGGWGPAGAERGGKTLRGCLPPDALLGPLPRDVVDPMRKRLGAKAVVDQIRENAPRRPGDIFAAVEPGSVRQDTVDLLLLHPAWTFDDYQKEITHRHSGLTVEALPDLWAWAHEYVARTWVTLPIGAYGAAGQFSGPRPGGKSGPKAGGKKDRQSWARDLTVADPSLIMDFDRFRQGYRDAFGPSALEDTPPQNLRDLWHWASDLTRARLRGAVNDQSTQEARNPRRGATVRRFGRTVVGDVMLGGRDFMEGIVNKLSPELQENPDVKAKSERREEQIRQWMQGGPEDAMSGPWGTAITEEVGAQVRKRTPEAIRWALETLVGGTVGEAVAESAPVVAAAKVVAGKTAPWIADLLVDRLVETPIDDAIWGNTLGEKDPRKIVQRWITLAQQGAGKAAAGAAKVRAWLRTPPGQAFAKQYGVTVQPEPGKEPIATYQWREPVTP